MWWSPAPHSQIWDNPCLGLEVRPRSRTSAAEGWFPTTVAAAYDLCAAQMPRYCGDTVGSLVSGSRFPLRADAHKGRAVLASRACVFARVVDTRPDSALGFLVGAIPTVPFRSLPPTRPAWMRDRGCNTRCSKPVVETLEHRFFPSCHGTSKKKKKLASAAKAVVSLPP